MRDGCECIVGKIGLEIGGWVRKNSKEKPGSRGRRPQSLERVSLEGVSILPLWPNLCLPPPRPGWVDLGLKISLVYSRLTLSIFLH